MVEPVWVGVLMTIMTGIGALLPKLSSWILDKKKQDQSDTSFVITNYKELVAVQQNKLLQMEGKLVDVQQKIVDMQTQHVTTLTENLTMKQQIQVLTAENVSLRQKVEDLERRVEK